MPKAQLSVIIPCFNQERFISRALDSVLSQSYENWECLVIDDGSSDGTRNLILHYVELDSRFKYFFQKNSGVSSARNLGLKKALGRYVHFMDADDLIYQGLYEKFIVFLEQHRDIDVVYGRYDLIDEADQLLPSKTMSLILKKNHLGFLVVKNLAPPLAIMYKNTIHDSVFFDQSLNYGEDWDFWLRLALNKFKFYGLNFKTGAYRRHNQNASNDELKMLQGAEQILEKNHQALKSVLGRWFDFDRSMCAIYIAAYARAVNNQDTLSIKYVEEKVSRVSLLNLLLLCLSPVTLPAVLNFAALKRNSFLYYMLFIPNKIRFIVRKISL